MCLMWQSPMSVLVPSRRWQVCGYTETHPRALKPHFCAITHYPQRVNWAPVEASGDNCCMTMSKKKKKQGKFYVYSFRKKMKMSWSLRLCCDNALLWSENIGYARLRAADIRYMHRLASKPCLYAVCSIFKIIWRWLPAALLWICHVFLHWRYAAIRIIIHCRLRSP